MEKRSHSRATKAKPCLIVDEVYKSFIENFNTDSFFELATEAEITLSNDPSSIAYKICSTDHKIYSLKPKLLESICTFYGDLQNLTYCLSLLKEKIKAEQKEKRTKKEQSLEKKLRQLTHTYSFEAQATIESVSSFFDSKVDIETALRFLPSQLEYKNYQSLQLLTLRKGHARAHSYQLSDQKVKYETIKTDNYNHLFNLIKKSKNKSFDQSVILKRDLNVVGTFLAKEISLKDFQIILIISRNDMFPATREEKKNFELVFEIVIPYLYQILKQEYLRLQLKHTEEGLKIFPYPFSINGADNKILLNNQNMSIDSHSAYFIKLNHSASALLNLPDNHNEYFTDHSHHERLQLLGELLNTLKHELGNPLFGISLTTELFDLEKLGHDSRTILQEISANSSRCLNVIKNFSFLYQDTKSILPTQIEKLISEVFTLSKSETREIKKRVSTNYSPSKHIIINTNPTLLTQVLFNLIINSAQSLKDQKGEKFISIDIDHQNNNLVLHVKDNGPGIPQSIRQEIFKPFYTTKEKGTGLGLAICRRAMATLGGSIELGDDAETGAHFILRLPCQAQEVFSEESTYN